MPNYYLSIRRIFPVVLAFISISTGLFTSASALASNGEVDIIGNIVSNTCNISINDRNKTVYMGVVSSKQFEHGTTTAFPKPFTLTLVDCGPAASAMTVGFQGPEDPNRHDLLAIDTGSGAATGLGIALLDSNKVQIPINTRTVPYAVQPNADIMVLHFYAQYTANGTPVKAGGADATATFDFIYD